MILEFKVLVNKYKSDDMLALENKLAYLTYHAYSEFIIYPYSSSYAAEAHNKGELDAVANLMVDNIEV